MDRDKIYTLLATQFMKEIEYVVSVSAETRIVLEVGQSKMKVTSSGRIQKSSSRKSHALNLIFNSTAVGHKGAGISMLAKSVFFTSRDQMAIVQKLLVMDSRLKGFVVNGAEADGAIVTLMKEVKSRYYTAVQIVQSSDADFIVYSEIGRAESDSDLMDFQITPQRR